MKLWQKFATSMAMALGLAGAMPAHAADAPRHTQMDQMRELREEDAVCTRCHDQSEKNPVLSIYQTRHGVKTDSRTPTCQGCHGPSEAHVKKTYTPNNSERPPVDFLGSKLKATAKDVEACVACHKSGIRSHWSGSAHEAADVLCTSCHTMHTHQDKVRAKNTQPEVCFACHKEQRAQYARPSRHLTKDGKMVCSDCHNPHGSAGVRLMQRDTINDTCYTCHMEKRGPFIRGHQPAQEDCSICHNPHGSTQPNLLKARPPFLCQQCHEPDTHQGRNGTMQADALRIGAAGATANNLQARGCLNCHTNTHGTNNPANINNERTMRR